MLTLLTYYENIFFINLSTSITSTGLTNLTYGANSQRTLKNDSYGSIAYIHGLSDFPLMEKIDYDGQPEITKLYVYGPTGLLAVNDDEGWFFMLKDHLGSTRVVLNESNNRESNYDYMPYGNIMRSSVGTEATYQFTGQEYDTELSLHNFRARMYDSDLGMFYAVDPAGQGFSSFGYAGNNPIIYVDKDGKFWHIVVGAVIGGIINTWTHADKINDGWDFLAAFGTGAAAGALGAATGGAAFAAAGGAAMGGGGFIAGFAGGGIGALFGSTVQSMGNTAFFNDPYPTIGDQLLTVGIGALTGGLINGSTAAYYGRNFINGNVTFSPNYSSISIAGNIQQQSPKTGSAQMPKAKIDGLLDDGLPTQQSNLRVLQKPEIPRTKDVFGHIFRNSEGHINPNTLTTQNRYMKLFQDVASNPNNLNQNVLPQMAIKSGVRAYVQQFNSGKIWVFIRNGKIINAGIN